MAVGNDKIADFTVNNYTALKIKHPLREMCSVLDPFLNSPIKQTLGSFDLPSTVESRGLYRTDGNRPDGVTMVPWEIGEQLVWDVTVVDAVALCRLNGVYAFDLIAWV